MNKAQIKMHQQPCCEFCDYKIPRAAAICPHCARAGMFPNVRDSKASSEAAALEERYRSTQADAVSRGSETTLSDFESFLKGSVAVIARSVNELQRLATSDDEIYATFYELIEAGVRSHTSDKWSILRAAADESLFPGYKKHIRFAALTINEIGLSNYGECSIVMRENMIAHRASVFEENSTIFMRHHDIKIGEADSLPRGYRAAWEDRHKLCIAKLAGRIDSNTQQTQYAEILLQHGATTEDDDFVEVHIWGPVTVRAVKQVTITQRPLYGQRVIIKALKEKLKKMNVALNVK